MGIKNKLAVFLTAATVFITFANGTALAGDGAERGTSPIDPDIKVVMPDKPASASPAVKHCSSLSYGLEVLKRARKLKKTSVGGNISFTVDDFREFAGGGAVNTVTLLTLPDPAEGVLKLGALDAFAGQTLTASLIGRTVFVPAHADASAEFTFSVNGDEAVSCLLYAQRNENGAPEADPLRVYTKCGVTAFASLDIRDPENDATEISVLSQPRRGLLKIDGDGSFSYRPDDGFIGRDSFVCRVSDVYGNTGEPVTVSVRVERNTAPVRYRDVAGTPAEYPAYLLAERGILIGETVGDTCSFGPDKTVSTGDFIVMAMKASGYSPNVYGAAEASSDGVLTPAARGYMITAASAGVVSFDGDGKGETDLSAPVTAARAAEIVKTLNGRAKPGGDGDRPLTRAEAAVMLASIVDAGR